MRACGVVILLGLVSNSATPTRLTFDGQEKQRPRWSPDGKTLTFARHESGGLKVYQYLFEPDKLDSLRRLTKRDAPEYQAVFTPDSKRLFLVVITLSGTQGNLDIAAIDKDGGDTQPIVGDTNGLSHQEWPALAPDGKRFAFSSTHEGNQEIYTATIDGTDVTRITQSPGHDAHPCWTPDGQSLIFSTDRWSGLELAICKADGTGLRRLTESPGLDDYPAVSPDGQSLAFVSNRDGQYEIYVARIDGSNPTNLTNHPDRDTQPTWTPDGKAITFLSGRDGGCDLYTIEVETK